MERVLRERVREPAEAWVRAMTSVMPLEVDSAGETVPVLAQEEVFGPLKPKKIIRER
jgi:hypothetical protein